MAWYLLCRVAAAVPFSCRFVGGGHAPSMHKDHAQFCMGTFACLKASSQEEIQEPNDAATPSAAEASELLDVHKVVCSALQAGGASGSGVPFLQSQGL